ncbi:MAG: pyridoxamine 5'-phosphate oxidase family protein [Oscillospiraceae bacterium]|nr:pyridoxamine 5'-phosphate oxidase family protein [Oscillospiraceae bacterium]
MQEVYDFLEKAGAYHIATVDKDGKPHVRPFGSKMILNGKFYIFCSLPKAVYEQLSENKWTEISACGEGMNWLRITATAREVTGEEKQEIYDKSFYAAPDSPMKRAIDTVAFFELTDATAIIYGQEQKEYKW